MLGAVPPEESPSNRPREIPEHRAVPRDHGIGIARLPGILDLLRDLQSPRQHVASPAVVPERDDGGPRAVKRCRLQVQPPEVSCQLCGPEPGGDGLLAIRRLDVGPGSEPERLERPRREQSDPLLAPLVPDVTGADREVPLHLVDFGEGLHGPGPSEWVLEPVHARQSDRPRVVGCVLEAEIDGFLERAPRQVAPVVASSDQPQPLECGDPLQRAGRDPQRLLDRRVRLRDRESTMGLARDAEERIERPPPQVLDLLRREPIVPRTEVRLETVVGEQLDELLRTFARGLLDPRRDRRVRARPLAPGEALVGDLAREDVLEDELRLPGDRRREPRQDQVPLLQSIERGSQPVSVTVQQTSNGSRPEHATDHGGTLERALLHGVQQVDPGSEHGLHRVRDLHLRDGRRSAPHRALLGRSHPRRSGGGRSPRGRTGCLRRARGSVRARSRADPRPTAAVPRVGPIPNAVSGSRPTDETLRLPPPQPGRSLGQLRSRRTDQERRPDDSVGELLQQVEQRLIGPMDVIDHRDDRRSARERREQRTPRCVDLEADLARLHRSEGERWILHADAVGERGRRLSPGSSRRPR